MIACESRLSAGHAETRRPAEREFLSRLLLVVVDRRPARSVSRSVPDDADHLGSTAVGALDGLTDGRATEDLARRRLVDDDHPARTGSVAAAEHPSGERRERDLGEHPGREHRDVNRDLLEGHFRRFESHGLPSGPAAGRCS